jgi:glycosyltransferase involved in cell wall biosynthesis
VDAIARDACLASSGVLLMPSLWNEAFGMAGLEALAQGTPVVAYDVGGISEWCHGGAGRLVPCGDVRQAARAVRELADNPSRWAVHSRAAKQVALLEFPTTRFGSELDDIVRQLRERT